MKLWKIAGKHFALGLLADLIATCSEARRGRVDLIVAVSALRSALATSPGDTDCQSRKSCQGGYANRSVAGAGELFVK